ncbi:MAG: hypothetical protein ACD_16C00133G0002 [uncultured bacterium]|nr:MAG: hypothetical protein ACD_16C00133G0002 [uncultured bacterium]OFW73629.1 MAG: hypothetical protein A2Z80_00445 [Alphaproteobacteria bacterium GWA2_41_27]OFW93639.1 MAG: hypothetical protein A2W46_03055 [Alphaproteobacteria bacterium RIFCSPHIGHO2_12_42_13]OFX05076.1 MAG: hypothetical protein A3H46_06885 [Alphaproteobacteria bacterium RIFCSPLOWO2_02_FULL_43_54]OFX07741.1 MAG: hypothetical protein A3G78_07715 [Alphaproteobacteria bacterium RIFCSPLOWO2_12_FULL_42_29]HBW24036.1 hypothetical 
MIREVTAMLARQTFGTLLNEVKFRKIKDEFEALTAELGNAYVGCEKEIAEGEISEAIEKTKKS